MQGLAASADGRTIAARATTQSGRVFVVRDGKLVGMLPTAADAAVPSPDGTQVAVTTGRQLKWYAADGRLQWVFRGDDTLRNPRVSPDGKRLAVGSELGTLYVLDIAAGGVRTHDLGALAVPAWLPDGDLVAATWMGTVCRLGPEGQEKWRDAAGTESPCGARSRGDRRHHSRDVLVQRGGRTLAAHSKSHCLQCGHCAGDAWEPHG